MGSPTLDIPWENMSALHFTLFWVADFFDTTIHIFALLLQCSGKQMSHSLMDTEYQYTLNRTYISVFIFLLRNLEPNFSQLFLF